MNATTSPSASPSVPSISASSDPTDEAAIAQLMTAIAAGDQPAIWALRELADTPVRARVRGELRRLGVRYEVEDLDAMVTDAVLAIADVAGGWRPGSAPPWAWAQLRVRDAVHQFVDTFADSLDEIGRGDVDDALGWLAPPAACTAASTAAVDPGEVIPATRAMLVRLATDRPLAGVLDAALSEVASERDAALWLNVLEERATGNHRPAVTVGTRLGMQPAAVRKAFQRVGQRLCDAVESGRFSALAALPALAASATGKQMTA